MGDIQRAYRPDGVLRNEQRYRCKTGPTNPASPSPPAGFDKGQQVVYRQAGYTRGRKRGRGPARSGCIMREHDYRVLKIPPPNAPGPSSHWISRMKSRAYDRHRQQHGTYWFIRHNQGRIPIVVWEPHKGKIRQVAGPRIGPLSQYFGRDRRVTYRSTPNARPSLP